MGYPVKSVPPQESVCGGHTSQRQNLIKELTDPDTTVSFCSGKKSVGISGQDGGVGRYASLPRTTKRWVTANLKTKNNLNCQKIKLYGSLTTKELKKKHLS